MRRSQTAATEDRQSIAEGDFDVTSSLHHLAVGGNQAQTVDGFGNRHMTDLVIPITDHGSEVPFVSQLEGFDAEACAENSIEGGWRAATLQMAKHATARFFAGALSDLMRYDFAYSAQTKFAIFSLLHHLPTVFWPGAFCDDNE